MIEQNVLPINSMQHALQLEIDYVKQSGGSKYTVVDGTRLARTGDNSIYSFATDRELRFPDGTRISLKVKRDECAGSILTSDGFTVILVLREGEKELAETIPMAMLHTAPWFLLEELKARLNEIGVSPIYNRKLATRLISPSTTAMPGDITAVRRLLRNSRQKVPLNDHQLAAIAQILSNDVTFVWGPPGTGKTATLASTATALAAMGQTVLIVAHSNVAVDVAMGGIARQLEDSTLLHDGKILRVGPYYLEELAQYPMLNVRGVLRVQYPEKFLQLDWLEKNRKELIAQSRKESLKAEDRNHISHALERATNLLKAVKENLKELEKQLIAQAVIVGCTLSKATIGEDIRGRQFDAVLIDEASMAYIPHCIFGAALARQRVAIFGDFRQLAPIAQSDRPSVATWLKRDVFEEAGVTERVNRNQPDSRLAMLATQYRMHPNIAAVPNRLYYGGRLQTEQGTRERVRSITQAKPQPQQPLVLFDIGRLKSQTLREKQSNSRFNIFSALLAAANAIMLHDQQQQVGIVTPFNAQSRLINAMLHDAGYKRDIVVATVHRYQGSERGAIVFDFVESGSTKPSLLLKSADSARLTNVAISRAKGKFIAITDVDYVQRRYRTDTPVRAFFEELRQHADKQTGLLEQLLVEGLTERVQLIADESKSLKSLAADIRAAKREVSVYWPADSAAPSKLIHTLQSCPSAVTIHISGSDKFLDVNQAIQWDVKRRIAIGIISIDRKCLWMVLSPDNTKTALLRLQMPQTVKLLIAFLSLIPDREVQNKSTEELIETGQNPIGAMNCPNCGSQLWLRNGRYGGYLGCTGSNCNYTRPIRARDATQIADLMQLRCPKCGSQLRGRKARDSGRIFLSCARYPDCNGSKSMKHLI